MNHIIPAILVQDEATFRSHLEQFEDIADTVQVDVLDNTLYPNTSWCNVDIIDMLDTSIWIELHLMVNDPEAIIQKIQRGGPIHRVIWHIEAPVDHADLVLTCQNLGLDCGIAIAPKTPIEALRPFAEMFEEILILGVEPGFSGQPLIPDTIQKARDIHSNWPGTILGFDGGVTEQTISQLRDAGVTRFCAASAIWKAEDPKEAYESLRSS